MFATMVIVLPSSFTGGDLEISHDGQNVTHSLSSTSAYSTSVLGWYADLLHKVHPLTSGYRLALTYNLVRPTKADSNSPPPPISPPDLTFWQADLRKAITKELINTEPTTKVVYLLDHMYPTVMPRYADLKGRDKHLLDVLLPFVAGEFEGQFRLALATLDISEEFDDYDGLSCSPSRSLGANVWLKLSENGQVVEYTKDEKKAPIRFVKGDPRKESTLVGAKAYPAGNEGMSAIFWYKHSVLVFKKIAGEGEMEEGVMVLAPGRGTEIDMRMAVESSDED